MESSDEPFHSFDVKNWFNSEKAFEKDTILRVLDSGYVAVVVTPDHSDPKPVKEVLDNRENTDVVLDSPS